MSWTYINSGLNFERQCTDHPEHDRGDHDEGDLRGKVNCLLGYAGEVDRDHEWQLELLRPNPEHRS